MQQTSIVRRERQGLHWGATLYCKLCHKRAPHLHRHEHEEARLDLCERCSRWFKGLPHSAQLALARVLP